MRSRQVLFGLVVLLPLVAVVKGDEPAGLRILYAGNSGSDRAQDFTGFLRQSFQQVDTTDYSAFDEEQAKGYDVVLFDWTTVYPRDSDGRVVDNFGKLNWPKVPKLSERYDSPTILIGAAGQRVVDRQRLKINHLCFCLGSSAHGLAPSHDIFQKPLKVNLVFDEIPTPPQYFAASAGSPIGQTIRVWRVQTKDFPEIDPGLVSDPYGFEDSPDAEIISAGLNSKGPYSVALGRQGNFFLWGFSASPRDMTPEAA